MKKLYLLLIVIISFSFKTYDSSNHSLSGGAFTQNWTTTTLITTNDNWSGVPSIQGFLGQDLTTTTGTDPQTLLATSSIANDLDVIANQSATSITNGGVAEFDGIPNPTIALQGSGTADASNLIIYLNTTGQSNVRVQYNLRDIDGTADNAIQPVALQFRVGNSGNFTNLPAGFVPDATSGPSIATLVTAVDVTLPGSCDNQPAIQVRIITSNAVGNDEWVGIDDINITSTGSAGPLSISTNSPLPGGTIGVSYNQTILASNGTLPYSFSISTGALPNGVTLSTSGAISGIPLSSGTFNFTVEVTDAVSATASKAFSITIINAPCSPPTHTIAEIQGSGNLSPFVGNVETTSGIVTGIRSNGFFMQTPDADVDSDPTTSEGIFVFTSSPPPAPVVVGNKVCVTGTITEFIPSTDPNSPAQTEIVSPTITLLSSGNPLPIPIVVTSGNTNPSGGLYQLERFESMRVQINSMTVVAPTQGNKTESAATSVSNGFFYAVITGVTRPFREPGVAQPDPLPPGAPLTVTRWDANPELIGIGSASIGGAAIDVATGAILTNVVGPLDYRSRVYTIDIDPVIPPVVSNNGLTFTAIPLQTPDELTVASFNVERFYDDINDPNGDAVLTTVAYNNRLTKVSLAIRNVLLSPDIICMIEVEKLTVLQAIATKINNDALAAGNPNPNYIAYLVEGNDVGGIDVGFLVKSARVNVTNVTQFGLAETYTDPGTGLPALLNDRPPLVLNGTFTKPGCTTSNPITVIVNHLRSLNGVDDVGANGVRVRAKRKAQAEYLANLIQGFQSTDPFANIISVGDYNAFEFSDGYVDLMGTIKGSPTPPSDVVLSSSDLVNPNLINLVETHPANQRYSYSFSGSAQVLDHILVNAPLATKISRFSFARLDADFPEIFRSNPNRPERISDHDAPVAYILFTDNTPPVIICPANIIRPNDPAQCGAIVTYTAPIATDNCSGVTVTRIAGPASGSSFPVGVTTITHRATDASGNTADCSFTVTVVDNQPPVITCPSNITVSNNANLCSAVVNFTVGSTDNCASATLSQSTSNTVVPGSVGCNAGGLHTDNSYWRAYQLALPAPVAVNSVTFGIELANAAGVGTTQPVNVRVYTSAGAFPGGVRTQVASQTYNIPDQSNTLFTANFTTPATVPGNAILVLEVNTPSGQAAGHSFFIGSNSAGQSAPSYISAADCGIATPSTLASIGFPNMHIILNAAVSGSVPVVSVPASGSIFPVGTTRVTSTATDAAGNTATCQFDVTVNDTQAPTITCPANVTRTTDVGVCTATFAPNNPTAADNCAVTVQTWALTGATVASSPATGINTVGSRAFNLGVTTVTYTVRDAAGNSTSCSFTVTITDALLPTITAQPANRTVCAGATATFSVTAVTAPTAGGPLAYQWQQFNGTIWVNAPGASTASTYSVANTTQSMNTNTFRVVVTGLCTSVNSNAATLFVNALPTISLTASNGSVLLPGQTTSIVANVSPTGGTFAWFKNGTPRVPTVTTGTLTNLTVDDAGTYRATYTDPNGCVATSADLVISAEVTDRLFVAPNPNAGQFWIRYYNQTGEPLTIAVFDSKGRRVHQQQSATGIAYTRIDVDMGIQAGGIYVVEVRGTGGRLLGRKQIVVAQR